MFNKTFIIALVLCACYFGGTMARPQLGGAPTIPGLPGLPPLPPVPPLPSLPGVGTITGVASDATGGLPIPKVG